MIYCYSILLYYPSFQSLAEIKANNLKDERINPTTNIKAPKHQM